MRSLFGGRGLVAAVLCAAFLSACAPKPVPKAPEPAPPPPPQVVAPKPTPQPAPPPPPPARPPAPPRIPTDEEVFASKPLDRLNAERPLGDVFFEYDRAELSDAARAVLQKNAEWLRRWTSTRVLLEGHADARGTAEYNLALGERRASAVRDYLLSLGVPAARLTIVSKGEEEPACREDEESCWLQNRRARFVIIEK